MSSSGAGAAGITYKAGQYYLLDQQTDAAALFNGLVFYLPLALARGHTFTGILLNMTAAGPAGSVLRVGQYADNGAGAPGAKLAEFGTIATDVAPGNLTLGGLQIPCFGPTWLAMVLQVSVATQPSFAASRVPASIPGPTDLADFPAGGALRDTANLALPGQPLPAVASPGLAYSFYPVIGLLA